ncbi:hypothetical protein ASF41_13025 [Methylobacterium sp. Leaf111]|uniref:hypothetical protein n=1 Tax=Methylobacterium sp. Leaf111 TaxID=1736257 RepID=UPI0006FB2CE8|nr:hypothetical protein [Methylobacterium sp. Leaf111]KQP51106.1 hypothetical protein ASF41_13025 [Methylobacterium sp. Leaf111]
MSAYRTRDLIEAHDGGTMPAEGIGTKGYEARIELRFGIAYRLPDVAEKLGISLRQVQAHIDDGSLVAVNVGRGDERRDLRVLDDDLDGFVRRRRTDAVIAVAFAKPKLFERPVPLGANPTYAERRNARIRKMKEI